jgi:UDP-N-acetylglucosamine diphosphorylase / glucose-1-phosphate thymidylyltransferase / UDP-N-acetylgalactosamine diphosphorylase / glucosamine-1-phosphate N-acetyltransferase / galactosamine-1-phosphate N-acetyltransferase
MIRLQDFVRCAMASPLAACADKPPWSMVANAEAVVRELLGACGAELDRRADVAVHRSATIESGAVIKGPAIIGAGCFIAAGAYLRGGVWLDEACVIGPGAELKSSFVFGGSKLAHFNFVGDSILGSDVNLEAGSILANVRNERADKEISVRVGTELHRTGVEKFGALVGDGARIGANAVIAPGALIRPGQIVSRLSLLDQDEARA